MITFGRFGHKEDIEKEKKEFLFHLNDLMNHLNRDPFGKHKYNEKEIIKPLKEALKKEENSFFNPLYKLAFSSFLEEMGLSYYTLTQEEKNDILDMDFTYENWKDKSFVLINNFIKRLKNSTPDSIWFCFDDIYFVFHIEIIYQRNFSLKNIITYIRDYFILENTASFLKEYRDAKKFKEIQKNVIYMYPEIKEKYGMNRILEKLLSYITMETDYNYEKSKNILDNYYNKKKNNKIEDEESIKLKDKYD